MAIGCIVVAVVSNEEIVAAIAIKIGNGYLPRVFVAAYDRLQLGVDDVLVRCRVVKKHDGLDAATGVVLAAAVRRDSGVPEQTDHQVIEAVAIDVPLPQQVVIKNVLARVTSGRAQIERGDDAGGGLVQRRGRICDDALRLLVAAARAATRCHPNGH